MPRRLHRFWIFLSLWLLAAVSCQPAGRYETVKLSSPSQTSEEAPKPPRVPAHYAWLAPVPRQDIPIKFVPSTSPEWSKLPGFWSMSPHPVAGQQTVHLGQSPLGALTALLLAEQMDVAITIKVPLGLPEPTFPPANPPTYLKWDLGKRLFFDRTWLVQEARIACATCHIPERGFAEPRSLPTLGDMNTLSLVNCVYNRHQFWDGRVKELEQVVQRDRADEEPLPAHLAPEDQPGYRHAWNGVVHRLDQNVEYRSRFIKVYGTRPTQDNLAKALATYLRTVLAGNSVYDRAKQAADRRGASDLGAEDFERVIELTTVKALGGGLTTPSDAAAELIKGYLLFRGRAGCLQCHPGPLFTDHDFHNVGVRESDFLENQTRTGDETGRFKQVPIGLKEKRLIGAFRTPTLRNLPQTPPYFHDGSSGLLDGVVQYFNKELDYQPFLDPFLLEAPATVRRLGLEDNEVRALAVFLRALDGDPVPAVIAEPPKD